ncbi:unnamed protein product [Mesocestoides corti]|uniref:Toll-like receptor 1 n=1 Tax=Mesocestoides corti TaxID=53468 RepID=A0A0R3UEV8_MESCO|nr:unnamed protein product [Mesocestoides corti]
MHFRGCPSCFLYNAILWLVPLVTPLTVTPQLTDMCHQPDAITLICYLNCFEDIGRLLPSRANLSDIEDLLVYQSSGLCYPVKSKNIITKFTSLKRLHFTGPRCPFDSLPNLPYLTELTFTRSLESSVNELNYARQKTGDNGFPKLQKLVVNDVCCELFGGTIKAMNLRHLSFHCRNTVSHITGTTGTSNLLTFKAPLLETLQILENAKGFPLASASNLRHLRSVFVIAGTWVPEGFSAVEPRNLSSVTELVFTQVNPDASQKFHGCTDINAKNLQAVTLVYPPPNSISCPTTWRCEFCKTVVDVANPTDLRTPVFSQTVQIFTKSHTTATLSSFLPKVQLNTTKLIFNHNPLLIIDSEALQHFAHLKSLHVGQSWGYSKQNGLATLRGNPFQGLRRPQVFRFLKVALSICGCTEFDSFVWLKSKNADFDGEILCSELDFPAQLVTNKWISVTAFIALLNDRCNASLDELDSNPSTKLAMSRTLVHLLEMMYAFVYLSKLGLMPFD